MHYIGWVDGGKEAIVAWLGCGWILVHLSLVTSLPPSTVGTVYTYILLIDNFLKFYLDGRLELGG